MNYKSDICYDSTPSPAWGKYPVDNSNYSRQADINRKLSEQKNKEARAKILGIDQLRKRKKRL